MIIAYGKKLNSSHWFVDLLDQDRRPIKEYGLVRWEDVLTTIKALKRDYTVEAVAHVNFI